MFKLFRFILRNVNLALIFFYVLVLPIISFLCLLYFFNSRIGDMHISVALSIGVVCFMTLIISLMLILKKLKNISDMLNGDEYE